MKISKKGVNVFLFILFFLFAVVQLNDPDGIIWFLIYGMISMICLYSNFKVIPKSFLIVIILLLLIYAAFHFSLFIDYLRTENKEEIFGKMVYEKPYLEGSREFMGLLIAAFGVFYQLKRQKKLSNKNSI